MFCLCQWAMRIHRRNWDEICRRQRSNAVVLADWASVLWERWAHLKIYDKRHEQKQTFSEKNEWTFNHNHLFLSLCLSMETPTHTHDNLNVSIDKWIIISKYAFWPMDCIKRYGYIVWVPSKNYHNKENKRHISTICSGWELNSMGLNPFTKIIGQNNSTKNLNCDLNVRKSKKFQCLFVSINCFFGVFVK